MLLWAMVGIPRGSGAVLPTPGRASPPDTRITFLQITVQHFVAVTLQRHLCTFREPDR